MRINGMLAATVVIGLLSASVVLPVFAQSTDVFEDVGIVVTATRLARPVTTVPASVRVITRKQIEQSGATDALEVLAAVPGITLRSTSGSVQGTTIAMAGFDDSRIAVLVDGRPINRPDMAPVDWLSIPLSSIERIEVVRGPASALYGDRAVAGVVNVITAGPAAYLVEVSAAIDTTGSNRQALSFSQSGAQWDGRLTLTRTQETPTRNRTDSESLGVITDATLRLGRGLTLSLSGRYIPASYQLPGSLTEEQFRADPDQANNLDDEVKSTTAELGVEAERDDGITRVRVPVRFSRVAEVVDFASFLSFSNVTIETVDARPQFSGSVFIGQYAEVVLSGGGDVRYQTLEAERFPDSDRNARTFRGTLSRIVAAPWLRAELIPHPSLSVDAGTRYEFARLNADSDQAPAMNDSVEHTPFVFDVGAVWKPTETVKLDIRYARVFRYPSFDEQVSYYGLGDAFYTDIDPEQGHHLTAGAEFRTTTWNGTDVALSAAPYYLLMADEVAYDMAVFRNVNLDETRRFGARADARLSTRQFAAAAGYAFDHAVFAAGPNSGNRVPLAPQHSGTIDARLNLPIGLAVGSTVALSGSFYQGGDEANAQPQIDGRVDWDAQVSWEPAFFPGTRVYVAGKNLLDDRASTSAFYVPPFEEGGIPASTGRYPMAGRRCEVGARWRS